MADCAQRRHKQQKFLTFLYHFYRGVSPYLGLNCRFYPSCSVYAFQVCKDFGILRGGWYTIKRLLRCHPGSAGGYDPPPVKHNLK